MNVGNHTNILLADYLNATGKTGSESLITPQEYLLFRKQAIDEIKQGIHLEKESSSTQKITQEPKFTSSITETTSPVPKDNAQEQKEEKDVKEDSDNGITPIQQGIRKMNSNQAALLAIMQSVEG